MFLIKVFKLFLLLTVFVGFSSALYASRPEHANGGKPGHRSGLIKANKHIFYQDCEGQETLEISFKLPHDLKAFWEGNADAHLVVAIPNGDEPITPLAWNMEMLPSTEDSELEPDEEYTAFVLSCTVLNSLEPGDYHFAIILTVPDGNPADLADWYNAFEGLVATARIRLSDGATEDDQDGDGEFDDDEDGDGFEDEEESSDDGSS